ncbi:MAG: hypothetical protein CME65_13260 [Halobacteriovoraceae bacterium]|nr:hypothetical protein [Halobacteriovoraceae bacterium]|tara:strand:- start:4114 stop:5166 length:1053 start_codon:yes stop_codon:yes gene_type:complete
MKVYHQIPEIKLESQHPYISYNMFKLWEKTNVTSIESGWEPLYFVENDSFSYAYKKSHSYGEFIFDWAWADLYHRYQIPYYPKLLHALPVTPISAPKIINPSDAFIKSLIKYYLDNDFSGHHILFTHEDSRFIQQGYFYQKTLQFHFINRFETYEDYLSALKARKRKNILKERKIVEYYPIKIIKKESSQISLSERKEIYLLYLSTIMKKYSQAYLTENFFLSLESGFYYLAYQNQELIAMSLFFEGEKKLYGRYWGIRPEFENQYSYLHFEMCYYLAIEYVIENRYLVFEAGAQGEQKLLRGFTPVEIGSLHHIKQPQFRVAIENHVKNQNLLIEKEIETLKSYLPYKK